MPKIFTDEELLEVVEVRNRHKTLKAAAKELDITWASLNTKLLRAAERGLDGSTPAALPLGQVVSGISSLYKMNEAGEWEEKLQWVKTKSDKNTEDFIAAIKATFDQYEGRAKPAPAPKSSDKDLLSVYPIADQHNGLMAWGEETGEDYDLKIGADRLRNCAKKLIAQSPDAKQAIILNLGDWQHTDDSRNATPASGNVLDVDGRYMKVLTTGIQLLQDVVELALQKHETVLVRNLPGNHDPHAAVALTVALNAFYSKESRVTIDIDPSEFFFHRFGQNLFGANHGHRMKPADMAMMLAVRRKEDWGQTKFKQFFFGHIHHASLKEIGGVMVESFQTLAAKDGWSHAKGFTSGQSLTGLTYHKADGPVGRHQVHI